VDVFIVEDSVAMRQRLVAALEEVPGLRILGWVDSADEATAAIERLRPHLVVLDLRLTQGSGLLVLEAVKRLDAAPAVAVVTNYPHEQYRARCAKLGADFFFDKAKGLDGLLEAVRGLVADPRREGACA
jgi:DNA-binding NarL/FixJ family response regulator